MADDITSKSIQGQDFIAKVISYSQEDSTRLAVAGVKMSTENIKLIGITSLNPKNATIVITAVAVRKAMHATNLADKTQALECLEAVAKLGSTLALAGALAPTGVGAVLPLIMAAVEGYEVGQQCFVGQSGEVSHAIRSLP